MDKYLEDAIFWARQNSINNLPRMAAILILSDNSVLIGENKYKTHPLQKQFGRNIHSIHLHAEIDAIVQATRVFGDIKGSSLYIARVLKDGTSALAKPCIGCQRAIIHFGIQNVWWTE